MKRPNYEEDNATFPAEAYTAKGYRGVAWRVYGWELETVWDDDIGESTDEQRTGKVVAVMVGDDRRFTFDPSDLEPLDDLAYCAECGQIGCGHDGRDRSDG